MRHDAIDKLDLGRFAPGQPANERRQVCRPLFSFLRGFQLGVCNYVKIREQAAPRLGLDA